MCYDIETARDIVKKAIESALGQHAAAQQPKPKANKKAKFTYDDKGNIAGAELQEDGGVEDTAAA